MAPRTTGQGVGGSSSTGAKLPESTWRGSTERRRTGGSKKLWISSSRSLQMDAKMVGDFRSRREAGCGRGGGILIGLRLVSRWLSASFREVALVPMMVTAVAILV